MKKIFRNNRLIAVAFFTTFSVGSAQVVLANENGHTIPVELKFTGLIKNQPLFQLRFAGNAGHDEFTIVIRDEDSNILYRENIKAENFTKSFLLNTDEIGEDILQFEISSKKSNTSVVYEVNRHTRFVEELVLAD